MNLSRDKNYWLTGVSTCHVWSFECLRHIHLSLWQRTTCWSMTSKPCSLSYFENSSNWYFSIHSLWRYTVKSLEYDIIFPALKRLEENHVALENRSSALQWLQNLTSTTWHENGVVTLCILSASLKRDLRLNCQHLSFLSCFLPSSVYVYQYFNVKLDCVRWGKSAWYSGFCMLYIF